jgi:hypothetical protein
MLSGRSESKGLFPDATKRRHLFPGSFFPCRSFGFSGHDYFSCARAGRLQSIATESIVKTLGKIFRPVSFAS